MSKAVALSLLLHEMGEHTWIVRGPLRWPQSSHLRNLLSLRPGECGQLSLGRELRRSCRVASGWRDKDRDVVPESVSSTDNESFQRRQTPPFLLPVASL